MSLGVLTQEPPRARVTTTTLLSSDAGTAAALLGSSRAPWAAILAQHGGLPGLAIADGVRDSGAHGESILGTFATPRDCVAAAIELQVRLRDGGGALARPVGMGIFAGRLHDPPVDGARRAARIAAMAFESQILVAAATAELLEGDVGEGVSLRALGTHRPRDLGQPEVLFQVVAADLPDVFPALRSLDNPEFPNNLPSSLSPFVGRSEELEEVGQLLAANRLITLTGAGGSGKTRLALHAAAHALDDLGEGVWLVELAPVSNADDVAPAVAAALELRVESDRPAIEALVTALRDQSILIVLDNSEHVIEAVAHLARSIVGSCPRVTLLVTSREPLGVDGERIYRVRSMSLPPEGTDDGAELAGSDAVQLFVTRSARGDPEFALDDGSARLAGSVCRRLDGIPLAIELAAAARHGAMSLAELSRGLDERFRLLTGGSRNALPRQQTLDAMVEWSYDMLSPAERSVLRRLSVFIDGFDLGGAQAVCTSDAVGRGEIAGIVDSLVAKSLVGAERVSGAMWYSLLEVIRHFAAERLLQDDGEAVVTGVRRLHATYHLELCESAGPYLLFGGDDQLDWIYLLDRQWGNVQRALTFFEWEPDAAREIVRLVWSLGYYDLTRQHRQPYAALQTVLDATRDGSPELRCRALVAWSLRASNLDNDVSAVLEAVIVATTEAVQLAHQLDDPLLACLAMLEQARSLRLLDRAEEAREVAEVCLELATEVGRPSVLGRSHELLAFVQTEESIAQAHRLAALAHFREAGDRILECTELMLTAIHGWERRDDVVAGRERLEDALTIAEQLASGGHMAYLWANLAITCAILDELGAAEEYCRRNLRAVRRLGMTQGFITFDMLVMSRCVGKKGDPVVAAQLAGAADAFWNAVARPNEFTLTPFELDLIARNRADLAAALGADEFDRLFETGQRLSVDRAVDLALGRIQSPV